MLLRAGVPIALAWAALLPAHVFPGVDSTRAPYVDLTSEFALAAYWMSQSGGKFGLPMVAVLMLLWLVGDPRRYGRLYWKQVGIVVVIASLCVGAGAAANEHLIKPAFKIARPNIVWLAGAHGSGPLGMSADAWYALGDKQARRDPLRRVLLVSPSPLRLAPEILEHWVQETGYSFPSGHALSAMFLATFFLAFGVSYLPGAMVWRCYVLLPWSVAVGYSRLILRVHTPTDIAVGGLEGLVMGCIAWLAVRAVFREGRS